MRSINDNGHLISLSIWQLFPDPKPCFEASLSKSSYYQIGKCYQKKNVLGSGITCLLVVFGELFHTSSNEA